MIPAVPRHGARDRGQGVGDRDGTGDKGTGNMGTWGHGGMGAQGQGRHREGTVYGTWAGHMGTGGRNRIRGAFSVGDSAGSGQGAGGARTPCLTTIMFVRRDSQGL